MKRTALVIGFAIVLGASAVWTGRAQAPANAGQNQNAARFTGTSTVMEGKDLSAARRHFDAGARTYWHSHDRGQLLLVEEGRMRVQRRGQPMRELGSGESDYTGAGIVHWHGAAPDQPLTQINVGFGGGTKWLDEVTSDEYNGKK
jgi:quercetin dioxygenase-like cupin family protein